MNAIVTVCGHAVDRLEYRNQPVITLPMIDEIHERRKKTSKDAFLRNREMFIEGTDYFEVPYVEWNPILKACQTRLQDVKKANLVACQTRLQDGEYSILNTCQTRIQDGKENLEFPFPGMTQPAASYAAEAAAPDAKTTGTGTKQRHPELPLPEPKQKHGGHRGSMFFLTESGYLMLTTLFNDARSKEIKVMLVRSYFKQRIKRRIMKVQSLT